MEKQIKAVFWFMVWLKSFLNKHPIILVLLFLIIVVWFIWWLNQPIEIIYDPDAPPLWIDDDPEGGYFPRR